MRAAKFIPIACLLLASELTSGVARADDSRLVSLREQILALAGRVKVVRGREGHTQTHVREESERILGMVESRQTALQVRLDVLDLAGLPRGPDEATVQEMLRAYGVADRLITMLETWYSIQK